jgi:hypothetical protein
MMTQEMLDNPTMMQECIVVDTTRLIKEASKEFNLPPQWVMSAMAKTPTGKTFRTRIESSHARHRVISELADMGYPRDLIARSFDLGRDSINSIIREFRKKNHDE